MCTGPQLHVGSCLNTLHTVFHLIFMTNEGPHEPGMIIPTDLRLREVKALAKGHRVT